MGWRYSAQLWPDSLLWLIGSLGTIQLFGEFRLRFDVSVDWIVCLIALFGGIYAARRVRLHADRIQEETGLSPVTRWQRLALIVAPAVMVLVALGFHLGYPAVKGFSFPGGTHMRNPLISRYLNLTKNSSLAIAVGYMDIIATLGGNTLNQAGRALETILLQALGRQSDLLILKSMCVEFIRGVRPITLLVVASTLLNVFLPPGANFDLILRGITMPQALKISIRSIVSTFIARVFFICCFSMSRYSMYPARTLQTGHR